MQHMDGSYAAIYISLIEMGLPLHAYAFSIICIMEKIFPKLYLMFYYALLVKLKLTNLMILPHFIVQANS